MFFIFYSRVWFFDSNNIILKLFRKIIQHPQYLAVKITSYDLMNSLNDYTIYMEYLETNGGILCFYSKFLSGVIMRFFKFKLIKLPCQPVFILICADALAAERRQK